MGLVRFANEGVLAGRKIGDVRSRQKWVRFVKRGCVVGGLGWTGSGTPLDWVRFVKRGCVVGKGALRSNFRRRPAVKTAWHRTGATQVATTIGTLFFFGPFK